MMLCPTCHLEDNRVTIHKKDEECKFCTFRTAQQLKRAAEKK